MLKGKKLEMKCSFGSLTLRAIFNGASALQVEHKNYGAMWQTGRPCLRKMLKKKLPPLLHPVPPPFPHLLPFCGSLLPHPVQLHSAV